MPQILIYIINPETSDAFDWWQGEDFEAAEEQLGKMERRWQKALEKQEAEEERQREL